MPNLQLTVSQAVRILRGKANALESEVAQSPELDDIAELKADIALVAHILASYIEGDIS